MTATLGEDTVWVIHSSHCGDASNATRRRRGGRPPALDEAQIRAAKAMLASGDMLAIEVAVEDRAGGRMIRQAALAFEPVPMSRAEIRSGHHD
jgi:hypothetical protein